MNTKNVLIATVSVVGVATVSHSCVALATSAIGVSILKKVLLGGITKGVGIFKNKNAFLQSDLIDKALPKELRAINTLLEGVAPNLVAKEKDFIAQAAAYTVDLSEPILVNAVNSLTSQDVERIATGGQGMETQILKEKTSQQLIQAITPKVDQKLNEFDIVRPINNALKANNLLGNILGNSSAPADGSMLSKLASEQLVNGLFNIIEDYEKQNASEIYKAFGK